MIALWAPEGRMADLPWTTRLDVHVPDGAAVAAALARTTHLAIAAHQDDLEIMAWPAIADCFRREDRWFGGVVLTSGAGSPRAGAYGAVSDAEMARLRGREQRAAAEVGAYGFIAQAGLPSAALREAEAGAALVDDLAALLRAARPEVVLLHNPADRHPTHVAAFRVALAALRASHRPEALLGCEVWGSLDWLPVRARVELSAGERPHLAAALLGVFDSQIAGGKRYDLAAPGRWAANATFSDSHRVDATAGVALAMDLLPLLDDPSLTPEDLVDVLVREFAAEARARLLASLGS